MPGSQTATIVVRFKNGQLWSQADLVPDTFSLPSLLLSISPVKKNVVAANMNPPIAH
jgi:hypothetical protein